MVFPRKVVQYVCTPELTIQSFMVHARRTDMTLAVGLLNPYHSTSQLCQSNDVMGSLARRLRRTLALCPMSIRCVLECGAICTGH
jgi:hypothetical protein